MAEASMALKAIQMVSVLLLTAYFMHLVYEIYSNKDKWASNFYSSYGVFENWWNKQFKRTLMNEFAYTVPAQSTLQPYRQKGTVVMGYCYGFGSLLLWTGEIWASLILLVPHVLHSLIIHGPIYAKTQTFFDRADQAWVLDFTIIAALLMVTGSHLQIASPKKEQVKYESEI